MCPECARLWTIYTDLIGDQTAVLAEYEAAAKAQDGEKMEILEHALLGAEKFRSLGREQLMAHRATHGRTDAAVA